MDEKEKIEETDGIEEAEFVTLTDEEGNEGDYEVIGTVDLKGNKYFALVPEELENDSEYLEYVIVKLTVENGEELLVSVDDEAEFDDVANYFDNIFANEIDCDGKIE